MMIKSLDSNTEDIIYHQWCVFYRMIVTLKIFTIISFLSPLEFSQFDNVVTLKTK